MPLREPILLCLAILAGLAPARAQTVIDGSDRGLPRRELAVILRGLNAESSEPSGVRIRALRRRDGDPVVWCGEISVRTALGESTAFEPFSAVPGQEIVFSPFDYAGGPFEGFASIIRAHCGP